MAAIEIGIFNFGEVVKGDMLDVSVDIEGIDLTNKTLLCQWKKQFDFPVVLEFNETDASLIKTIISSTKTTIRFMKESSEMNIPQATYKHTIIMFITDEDIQTIVEGTVEVVNQITTKV